MKITIDRNYTEAHMMERTKEQSKEFKEIYTENDLLRMFTEATGEITGFVEEIVYCRLSAFPGGSQETDETHYSVDMLIDTFRAMYKIHFYISQSGEVDTREILFAPGEKMKMWQFTKYTAA